MKCKNGAENNIYNSKVEVKIFFRQEEKAGFETGCRITSLLAT